jgi:catechol 2,3-dioxygenase-like lactoylglutathione lyase family enzyme
VTACLSVAFEHAATTVPDLEQAERFFVDVLGARVRFRSRFAGSAAPEIETFDMARTFNAHPDSRADLISLDVGGSVVELFAYDAPDQRREIGRNCDVGGSHLGFRVTDLAAAVRQLQAVPGVRVLGSPNWAVNAAGDQRGWVYFLTPWGLQMELSEERSETA